MSPIIEHHCKLQAQSDMLKQTWTVTEQAILKQRSPVRFKEEHGMRSKCKGPINQQLRTKNEKKFVQLNINSLALHHLILRWILYTLQNTIKQAKGGERDQGTTLCIAYKVDTYATNIVYSEQAKLFLTIGASWMNINLRASILRSKEGWKNK